MLHTASYLSIILTTIMWGSPSDFVMVRNKHNDETYKYMYHHYNINGESGWKHPASGSLFKQQPKVQKYNNSLTKEREDLTLLNTIKHHKKEYWFSIQPTWELPGNLPASALLAAAGGPRCRAVLAKSEIKFWVLQEPIWYDRQDSKPNLGNATLDDIKTYREVS